MVKPPFGKANPFLASIKERRWLTKPGSAKNTCHIVLNLEGAGFQYRPGDSIGIFPINSPELVARTLAAMKATGQETVTDKNGEGSYILADYLVNKANLTDISRKFLNEIIERQQNPQKKEMLTTLLEDENKELLKAYLESHEVWDLLLDNDTVVFTPQEIVNLLMPLLRSARTAARSLPSRWASWASENPNSLARRRSPVSSPASDCPERASSISWISRRWWRNQRSIFVRSKTWSTV